MILEQMQKEIFNKRGVEYKIIGLEDKDYDEAFMNNEVDVEEEEVIFVIHKPVGRVCDRITKLPYSKIVNTSYMCPKCDLYSREKIEKLMMSALGKLDVKYDINYYLDDVDEHVRIYIPELKTALVYEPSYNQQPNFGELIDSESELLDKLQSSEYVEELVYFTSEHVSSMEEWMEEMFS